MANKTSWRSVSSGANAGFRRAMWFARLRAAGLYDKDCKRGVGACKNKTKASAGTLKQTKYANMSPKAKGQTKENPSRGTKAINELIAQGKKKGSSTAAQRLTLARNLREQGKQRGATTALTKESARVTTKSGETKKMRYSAAVGVSKSGAAKIAEGKKELSKQRASETRRKLFDKNDQRKRNRQLEAIKSRLTKGTVTTKKKK